MLPVVEKAAKILAKASQTNQPEIPNGFIGAMQLVKRGLTPDEYRELCELTLFGVARTVTIADVLEVVEWAAEEE